MNGWILIGTAAGASYLMRSIPLLIFRRLALAPDSPVVRFLQHAASAVMGSVIYLALFGESFAEGPLALFHAPDALVKLAVVLLAGAVARWRGSVFIPLLAGIAFYAAALLVGD
ncbi:AzlD domain-containing protein [Stenotrophomonas pennii]|uniref:AzlD domain-containing protein n=1 Tax=Stenotrophomonas lacuserhaii TaxID=2760084 RepID=UPI00320A1106